MYSVPNNDGLKIACPWEEFLSEATVERLGRDEWRVLWKNERFEMKYESFIMFPRPLCGATVFRLKKFEAGWKNAKYPQKAWEIHIHAEKGIRWRKRDILRVAWSHSGRKKGDYIYTLYDYDRLVHPKFRPNGAIGKPVIFPGNVRRFRLETHPRSSIKERYRYFTPDPNVREAGVILIETPSGCKWESSVSQSDRRYESLSEAQSEVLEHLRLAEHGSD